MQCLTSQPQTNSLTHHVLFSNKKLLNITQSKCCIKRSFLERLLASYIYIEESTFDMTVNYLAMFDQMFDKGYMASTYKPVFLRSLLDIGDLVDKKYLVGQRWLEQNNGNLYVDLNFIAVRFAKFYWDMEYGFHLKQAQDPHDARIVKIIHMYHNLHKNPQPYKNLQKIICKISEKR